MPRSGSCGWALPPWRITRRWRGTWPTRPARTTRTRRVPRGRGPGRRPRQGDACAPQRAGRAGGQDFRVGVGRSSMSEREAAVAGRWPGLPCRFEAARRRHGTVSEEGQRVATGPGVRGASRVPAGRAGLRLHRLQAVEPDPPRRQADGAGRGRRLRRVPRPPGGAPRRVHRAVQHDPHQRHRLLPRPGGLGRTCAARSCPRCSPRRAAASRSGVWSAGCASGEEAYTLAIVLAEALGPRSSGSG